MSTAQVDETLIPVAVAYPSQSVTARILGISEAQLSRRKFEYVPAGGRGKHYRPRVVLEAAEIYRRRSLNEVAGDLIAYAVERAPEAYRQEVRQEVEDFFATRGSSSIDRERFLAEAQRTLPRRLYAQVKRAYDHGSRDFELNVASEQAEARAGAGVGH